jgi:hypothetical protein
MKPFLSPNIGRKGRLVRGAGALLLLAAAAFALSVSLWLALVLALSGLFVLAEALRGWCALRACGIKTRL